MAFEKKPLMVNRPYDLSNPTDRGIVREFEDELDGYRGKSLVMFPGTKDERTLRGIELMFHEKGWLVFSDRYPNGAVSDVDGYRRARAKWSALQKLQDRRVYAASMEPAMA